jgi:hypothetical protein
MSVLCAILLSLYVYVKYKKPKYSNGYCTIFYAKKYSSFCFLKKKNQNAGSSVPHKVKGLNKIGVSLFSLQPFLQYSFLN